MGEAVILGDRAYRELIALFFKINSLESKLSRIRKGLDSPTPKLELCRQKRILWERVKNLVREMHWKSALYLVRNYQYIFLENFSSKNLGPDTKPLIRRVLNQYAFYQFKLRLEYLCEKYGCKLILVHPALTTKTCSSCGQLNNIADKETYTCSACHFSNDRDIHSSKNILIKGVTILSE